MEHKSTIWLNTFSATVSILLGIIYYQTLKHWNLFQKYECVAVQK